MWDVQLTTTMISLSVDPHVMSGEYLSMISRGLLNMTKTYKISICLTTTFLIRMSHRNLCSTLSEHTTHRSTIRIQNLYNPTVPQTLIGWFIVFNATFNNISVISWRSVLLVEETRVFRENHQPAASHWQTLSHNVISSTPRHNYSSNRFWLHR
jgi:hypothetical protein